MYRRTICCLCCSYHVPALSRVGLFPIHLDPPTQQHQEIFKLLLGVQESRPSSSLEAPLPSPSSCGSAGLLREDDPHDANDRSSGGSRQDHHHSGSAPRHGTSFHSQLQRGLLSGAPRTTAWRLPSKFWYLESFAESLGEDSQLAPFDDLILIPNTRYPVSLRQSTHLAALSVLAARGLPHVHVDFTALEHPDDSMPVVYELAQRYHNGVLVHWLHDAYEMLNWRNFAELRMHTPLLLLQTNSLPVSEVTRPPPAMFCGQTTREPHPEGTRGVATAVTATTSGSVKGEDGGGNAGLSSTARRPGLLHSRLYQDPSRVKDERFAAYYSRAADHIQAQHLYRELQSHPALREQPPGRFGAAIGDDAPLDGGVHYFDDVECATAAAAESGWSTPLADDASAHMVNTTKSGRHLNDPGAVNRGGVLADGAAVNDVDQLVRGEWWLTKGGRGDDRVEVSRSYSNAASSSWLGAPMPLGKKRMGIDVTAEAMLHEEGTSRLNGTPSPRGDGAAGLASVLEETAAATATEEKVLPANGGPGFIGQHRHGEGEVGDDDDADDDELYYEDDEVYPDAAEWLADRTDSDFVITEKGLVEITRGQTPTAAALRKTQNTEPAASPASSSLGAPLDPNEPRALFKEFAEVRVALEEMLEPTKISLPEQVEPHDEATLRRIATPARGSRRGAKGGNSSGIPAAADCDDDGDGAEQQPPPRRRRRPRDDGDGGGEGALGRGHRVLDPNSVVSRRNVRELLEELFPTLYYTRLQQRQLQQQRQPLPASDPLASRGNASNGDTSDGTTTQTDALLNEVSLLQQSRARGLASARPLPATSSSFSEEAGITPHGFAEDVTSALMTSIPGVLMSTGHTLPMVEVHPVTRCTGADVRQVLWEQDVSPGVILTDAVAKYVESHALYRDARKNADGAVGGSHASAYSSLFAPGGEELATMAAGAAAHGAGRGSMMGLHDQLSPSSPVNPTLAHAMNGTAGGPLNPVGGVASGYNYSALKRVLLQKEHAAMSFPGIIPRLELHYDKGNLLAREQYEKLKVFQCRDDEAPDLIVPIGGDGYMMHCIRNNWRRFIPFYGVNAGHVGYLLNDCATLEELFSSPLKLHTTNMLYCQAEKETETGERVLLSELAFNDAWVERSSGQTALIRILVNGEERIRRLRGDGVLVSTAAGSTAYSQALGASPVPVGAPLIQVVGSNVVSPAQWRPVHLDQEDQVEFEVIDNIKRPCRCFVDSVNVGNVTRMLVRSSRVAGVTLAFSRSCDLQHKLYQMQFPKTL